MANQIIIDIGATANDGTGDPLRTAFDYVNDNFSNVWNTGLPSSNVLFSGNRILTANTNGNLILSPNGIGKVVANVDIRPNANNTLSLGSSDLRWNSVYAQNLDVGGNVSFNNVTVGGNLTVQGNIIQVGNIVTETLTIQLANAAVTANSANGSGITVGANDNIATLLYNSNSNVWTTNIGISAVGNITAPYFIGNGSQLTGLPATYSNTNATSLLASFGSNTISTTGNVTAGYFIGNGSQLTGISTVSLGNLSVVGSAIQLANGSPNTSVYLTANGVSGNAYISIPSNPTTLADGLSIVNLHGRVEIKSKDGGASQSWYFQEDGSLQLPGDVPAHVKSDNDIVLETGSGDHWIFGVDGSLDIPGIISSSITIEIDNRATSNSADIRLNSADDIFLQGRDKPDDLEAEGGDIFVYGGDGADAATSGHDTGGGGDVQIEGGIGGTGYAAGTSGGGGGIISINGGDGGSSTDSTVGSGGGVEISAGSAADPISGDPTLGGLGGDVSITAGTTTRVDNNGGSITITTGSPTPIGTGAAGYVEINIPNSNVGPGGSWTFGGTGTTLNVPANAEIFGANAGNLTVGCAGNTIITSSDYGANVQNWVFGYTGQTIFPTLTVDLHNGGTQTGQVLQFGDPAQQAIITGPAPTANVNAQRLIVQGQRGNSTNSEGGDVYIWAGDADLYGGDIKIYAGDADDTADGYGGYVNIDGGQGFTEGGHIALNGGQSTNGPGGYVEIYAGQGSSHGGNLTLGGGYGGGGPGGAVTIQGGGSSNGLAEYGNVGISAGESSWTFDNTGNLTLPQGGVVYETNIPFGGLSGKTIALKPYGGTDADQQLLVYPTAGADFNHLHLTTGNLWNTEMFLGNDDFYVKLANTGNIVINANDSVGNTAQWTFDYNGTISTNDDFVIQVSDGIPSGVTAVTGSSGFWESNPVSNLATTGGTGTGLTVNVTESGGYASVIAIATAGTGYTNGDAITVTSGSSNATFTISVPTPNWTFVTDSSLTLPTISLGTDLDEQTVISSQRKLIPPFRWSAVIDGTTPTVVYTATNAQITSMKVTIQIQHSGVGMEFFEVFASESANDTYYTVSNRVAPPSLDASTVVVGLNGSNEMQITVTINSGAGTSWVTYDAVEFGIPQD